MKTIISFLVGATLAILTGCAHDRAYSSPSTGLSYQYYYYPHNQVYYDPDRQLYFWINGGVWNKGGTVPETYILDPKDRVFVRLDTDRPYLRDEEIRQRYGSVGAVPLPTQSYTFLYYPNHAVYFDPVSHQYYWYENSRWERHERPPHDLISNPESPKTVTLDQPVPEGRPQVRLGD